MVFSLILKIVLAQIVVISIIVFILKKVLDQQLIESAIHKLEVMDANRIGQDLIELNVITYEILDEKDRKRISDALYKKTNRHITLAVAQDKKIKGGIIIKLKNTTINHSLLSRLQESGMVK